MPDTTLPAIPGSPPTGNKDQIAPLLGAEGAAVKKSSDHVPVVPHKSHKNQVSRSLEYIPEEILAALKKPEPLSKELIKSRPFGGRAENVWFHGDVAKKYQHLIDYPPCSCGIGPRDISFLYDSVKNEERALPTPHIEDKGQGRKEFLERQAAAKRRAREGELPDTLIPKEFHLVQSKAALGLEYNKERFSLKTKDHEEHLTKFPSLKPVSRKEIIELRNVMDKMLSAVGADDSADKQPLPTSAPGGPPTQMHSLVSLVKQEQDIYNVIFHEIIRQTTVECKERGEILAALRQRYANLLDKVPRQVRSMHAEVMAQRALDRRLTEELLKFKTTINSLTGELTDVREQEQKIAEQSRKAKEELKNSLLDSEKNASLLTEYHDLYELQRQRLEHQISVLSEEKEIWSTACYTMAVKITENNRLNTAKRLHMAEKTWAKLASHYALFLADRDCELMSNLQSHVDK